MAMKPYCYFSIGLIGDGVSASHAVDFKTTPFVFGGAGGEGTALQLSPNLSPTSLESITSSDGQVVTAVVAAGEVTFTWPIAVPEGDTVLLQGAILF